MLNAAIYRKKLWTVLVAIMLLMLFTVAIVAPVMSHDHVEDCVKYDDDGTCLNVQNKPGNKADSSTHFTPSNDWSVPEPD